MTIFGEYRTKITRNISPILKLLNTLTMVSAKFCYKTHPTQIHCHRIPIGPASSEKNFGAIKISNIFFTYCSVFFQKDCKLSSSASNLVALFQVWSGELKTTKRRNSQSCVKISSELFRAVQVQIRLWLDVGCY